jgi:transcription-repair coupling factor (superfamily II helicase)
MLIIFVNGQTKLTTTEKASYNRFLNKGIETYNAGRLNEALETFITHHAAMNKADESDPHKKESHINDFETVAATETSLASHTLIEWGFHAHLSNDKIAFNTQSQPTFNRQFQYLIANLQELEKQGYALFLFAEQAKQLE